MKNYNKISITEDSRIELHDKLGLTGAEVSINTLPAGANVPFIHSHKNNEEIYAILDGEGLVIIDGEIMSTSPTLKASTHLFTTSFGLGIYCYPPF